MSEEIKTLKFPRYGCPQCNFHSKTFNQTANHMHKKKHFFEGTGTYPIFVQSLAYACAMGYVSLPDCDACREKTRAQFGGCWPGWQVQFGCFCQSCPISQIVSQKETKEEEP